MSKRFGRNQRRKMRDEIAKRDAEVARLVSVARDHFGKGERERIKRQQIEREMVNWASRIFTMMGPESPFNRELTSLGVDISTFKEVAFNARPLRLSPMGSLDSMGPTRQGQVCDVAAHVIQAFAVATEQHLELSRHAVGFYIYAPDGSRALAFDMRTLHALRDARDPWLAGQLLEGLIAPWFKGQG